MGRSKHFENVIPSYDNDYNDKSVGDNYFDENSDSSSDSGESSDNDNSVSSKMRSKSRTNKNKSKISNKIIKYINRGNLFIDDIDESNIYDDEFTNYYTLTLGQYYYKRGNNIKLVKVDNSEDIHGIWKGPFEGEKGDILVEPGETIMVHTKETIGIFNSNYIFTLYERLLQCGLSVQVSSLKNGEVNKVIALLTNHSRSQILIPVGYKFLHCMLFDVEKNRKVNRDKCMKIAEKWNPNLMLPYCSNIINREIKTDISLLILDRDNDTKYRSNRLYRSRSIKSKNIEKW